MTAIRQALALEYGQNLTPIVSAKGEGEVALKLLALLSRLKVDQEIPPELYRTVSVILSWVYWLKNMRPGDEKLEPENQTADSQASL